MSAPLLVLTFETVASTAPALILTATAALFTKTSVLECNSGLVRTCLNGGAASFMKLLSRAQAELRDLDAGGLSDLGGQDDHAMREVVVPAIAAAIAAMFRSGSATLATEANAST
jgi:hypothetical protein